jgi:3-hydroxyacyl-[acyl-carrier-protein] dehydratase
MKWIWIDRILELEKGQRCVALKNVSLAEDVLHDHFPAASGRPATPVLPNTLIIEGMAQTAGILVGHANDFSEKVILAKIGKASFSAAATPGHSLRFTARIENIGPSGASTSGEVELIQPETGHARPLAQINLLFSHIDQSRTQLAIPEHNFVFSSQLKDLLTQSGIDM